MTLVNHRPVREFARRALEPSGCPYAPPGNPAFAGSFDSATAFASESSRYAQDDTIVVNPPANTIPCIPDNYWRSA